jgi:hypothetical protein
MTAFFRFRRIPCYHDKGSRSGGIGSQFMPALFAGGTAVAARCANNREGFNEADDRQRS